MSAVSLQETRAHLLEVIRRRPQPEPQLTFLDVRRWERNGRREAAVRYLRSIPHATHVATLIGVTPRCILYWRAGQRVPTVRHWQQLRAIVSAPQPQPPKDLS